MNIEQQPSNEKDGMDGKSSSTAGLERDFILWANENCPHPDLEDLLRSAFMHGVETEREACAQICDHYGSAYFAEKIRTRSNRDVDTDFGVYPDSNRCIITITDSQLADFQ